MSQGCEVQARFFRPPAEMRRYFTTFYHVEARMSAPYHAVDYLHPEWTNFRFHDGYKPVSTNYRGDCVSNAGFYVTGPSSRAVKFEFDDSIRVWGVGILPLGWAKFIRADAADWADALVDGNRTPAFADFAGLADTLFQGEPDIDGELARITDWFAARLGRPVPDENRIVAVHGALVDPEVVSVTDLVARTGISQRTLERVCHRAFGFSPKLLLRRQRFLRSLAKYALDPSLKWIGALDGQYHDQAQFVRDFKQFMGMTPRQYAALEKPMLSAVMRERARFAGKAVQALDAPD